MRKISVLARLVATLWLSTNLALTLATLWAAKRYFSYLSEAGGSSSAVIGVFLWFALGVAGYRLILAFFPLRSGELREGSSQELVFQAIHLPSNFFFFDPIIRCGLLPTPLTRLVYKAFGARIAANSYPGHCMIFDPVLVRIGRNVSLGHQATLVPHVIEGNHWALHPIEIDDGVTIGVNAIVLAGVSVGKGAVVAAGAVVAKFTRIAPGEIWGGLPARRIGFVGSV